MLTENEIDRITAAVSALRPDWPAKSLHTLIADKLAHRTRRDVAVALTWVACDSDTKSPGRVLENGPWWTGLGQEQRVPRNPLPHEECGRHPGQYRLSCSGCASEKLAPVVELHRREDSQETLDWRAALAEVRASLCSCGCGVMPYRCRKTNDTEGDQ